MPASGLSAVENPDIDAPPLVQFPCSHLVSVIIICETNWKLSPPIYLVSRIIDGSLGYYYM